MTTNARTIVNIYGQYSHPNATEVSFQGNVVRANAADGGSHGRSAVLLVGGNRFADYVIRGNEFANPASMVDISSAGFMGSNSSEMVVDASGNLFNYGVEPTDAAIAKRIFDKNDSPELPEISFGGFLPLNVTIECVNNCNEQGSCVFPGFCVCQQGWGGEECSTPTCESLKFCSNHGTCTDFDVCDCVDGWLGDTCAVADCSERNNCNGNGECLQPNVCTCHTELGYTGTACDACTTDYRLLGGVCVECETCFNGGTCNELAGCSCPGNFDGARCQECKDGFFGIACTPEPYISSVFPNDSVDEGGTVIQVVGLNFGTNSTSIQCIFSGLGVSGIVDAAITADGVAKCVTPAVNVGSTSTLQSVLQLQVDGKRSFNSVPFTFFGECPEGSCINGFCSFGRCRCFFGFGGDACDVALVAPQISPSGGSFETKEGEKFTYQPILSEGSLPIQWSIISTSTRPEGMTIDADTGLVVWQDPYPVATNEEISIRIQAQNSISRSEVTVRILVLPTYYVRVESPVISRQRSTDRIPFTIKTVDLESLLPAPQKLAVFWVRPQEDSISLRRRVTVKTDNDGLFLSMYQPYSKGRFRQTTNACVCVCVCLTVTVTVNFGFVPGSTTNQYVCIIVPVPGG